MPNDAPDWNASPSTNQSISVANGATLQIPVTGFSVLIINVTSPGGGGVTVSVSADGTNFSAIDFYQLSGVGAPPAVRINGSIGVLGNAGVYAIPVAGMQAVMLNNGVGGGALTGTIRAENGPINLGLLGALPAASSYPVVVPPPDFSATAAPATGSQASVVIAGVFGQKLRPASIDCSTISVAAVATAPSVQLKDGASVIWQQWLGLSATSEAEQHFEKTGPFIPGTNGNSMTLTFTAGTASVAQIVNLAVYAQ